MMNQGIGPQVLCTKKEHVDLYLPTNTPPLAKGIQPPSIINFQSNQIKTQLNFNFRTDFYFNNSGNLFQ